MVNKKFFGSCDLIADVMPLKDNSQSKTLASRPILVKECESELEIRPMLSSLDHLQFMAGSLDKPVSTAKIFGAYSSKHSSSESKPDIEPKTENQGVQQCAGTIAALGSISKTILASSLASSPRIGLPSDLRLPLWPSAAFIFSTASTDGAKIKL